MSIVAVHGPTMLGPGGGPPPPTGGGDLASITGNATWYPAETQLQVISSTPAPNLPLNTDGHVWVNGTDIGLMRWSPNDMTPDGDWWSPSLDELRIEAASRDFKDNVAFFTSLDGTVVTVEWPQVLAPPTMSSYDPSTFVVNEANTIAIRGRNFVQGSTVLHTITNEPGGDPVPTTFVDDQHLTATYTPTILGNDHWFKVQNPDGQESDQVWYLPVHGPHPVIDSTDPVSAPVDTPVTMTLIGQFVPDSTVSIGSIVPATVYVSPTQLTATFTTGGAAYGSNVIVRNADGATSQEDHFFNTIVPPPTITSLSPASISFAAGAATFDIVGTLFAPGMGVKVANQWATGFVVASDTLITGVPFNPPGTGNYPVMVQIGGSTAGDSNTVQLAVTA